MKRLIGALCLSLSTIMVFSQNDSSKISIPMKDGKVYYQKDFAYAPAMSADRLKSSLSNWSKNSFPDAKEINTKLEQKAGVVSGASAFRIVVSESGNYYWMKFTWRFSPSDSGGKFEAFDFYEKPIEKGISNEYSKIEYRWWDFRHNKPWSPEDQKLFEGIEKQMSIALNSFDNYLNK